MESNKLWTSFHTYLLNETKVGLFLLPPLPLARPNTQRKKRKPLRFISIAKSLSSINKEIQGRIKSGESEEKNIQSLCNTGMVDWWTGYGVGRRSSGIWRQNPA
ncbi:unnamed protein product [Cuscuta europaea]|uniref:Uncharacterized protein n=1 Tax=Cuscuta europaea TaxID=41803 RepID=A0A9P1DZ56_CUSEU|nr:unnamed protein product [Cuscuta europaea]